MGKTRPFSHNNVNYRKKFDYNSVDDALVIWTQDWWMVGADESTG